jgi:hypothetical protein
MANAKNRKAASKPAARRAAAPAARTAAEKPSKPKKLTVKQQLAQAQAELKQLKSKSLADSQGFILIHATGVRSPSARSESPLSAIDDSMDIDDSEDLAARPRPLGSKGGSKASTSQQRTCISSTEILATMLSVACSLEWLFTRLRTRAGIQYWVFALVQRSPFGTWPFFAVCPAAARPHSFVHACTWWFRATTEVSLHSLASMLTSSQLG